MSTARETRPSGHGGPTQPELAQLLAELDGLLEGLRAAEHAWNDWLDGVAREYWPSARNLVHYWAIRQRDLRVLQGRLAAFGLSSLGRCEPHVEATLRLVRAAVTAMLDGTWQPAGEATVRADEGYHLLRRRAIELLGPEPADRETRIMVTLPSEAATDFGVVRELVQRGMNVARINCAHDDAEAWRAMVRHVRQASAEIGRQCVVAMDLAGPKLRTGPIEPGPGVVKLRPSRDALGRVVAPARAWLTTLENPSAAPEPDMTTIPVPRHWLAGRRDWDVVTTEDARGAKRRLILTRPDTQSDGFIATTDKTTYLVTGTVLEVRGSDDSTEVGILPPLEQSILLRQGETLRLTRDCSPAPVGTGDMPRIGCRLPEIFAHAQVGEKIHFDDGRISGEIVSVSADEIDVKIERAADEGSKLRAGKGINVPDTHLAISAVTAEDVEDLGAVVELADVVELSFVQDPSDVQGLHDLLDRLGAQRLGVVLKIETRRAFERLPQLLLAAMRRPLAGVMIARGDLAVEVGYQRLAEVQEEILWLCEAAHLPVIWATQVLEQLAKSGLPSRAEISDAAMGERAECVMLNKGPHIAAAVTVLDDILGRMTDHHYKKTALLRQLNSWRPEVAR